jgi:hypothetical protein
MVDPVVVPQRPAMVAACTEACATDSGARKLSATASAADASGLGSSPVSANRRRSVGV